MVKQNGKFGLLGPDGSWKVPAEYEKTFYWQDSEYTSGLLHFYNGDDITTGITVTAEEINEQPVEGLGGTAPGSYGLTEDGYAVFVPCSSDYPGDTPERPDYICTIFPVDVCTDFTALQNSEYYVWNPMTRQTYDPNPSSEVVNFGVYQILPENYPGFSLMYALTSNVSICGAYFEKQEDGTYVLYKEDGSSTISGFEDASVVSLDTLEAKRNGMLEVYDKDLNLLYTVDAQSASRSINGKTLLEKDGMWYLSGTELSE